MLGLTDTTRDWYRLAEQELSRMATAVAQEREVELGELEAIAEGIAYSIQHSDHLVVVALSGPAGAPVITNLINVGILATKVGMGLGYYGAELNRLALAGLLHDVGLFAVPQSLLTKQGRLTPEERVLVEQHPELGFELIKKLGADYDWLAEVVKQAHERWSGKGYPHGLKGKQINELAQVIGAIDVFEALISPRPYRRRLLPHEAVRELLVVERMSFSREIVKALVEQLSVYPLGTTVRLNTGETGVVARINPRYPLRPVLRVYNAPGGGIASEARLLDLSVTPLASILETVDPPAVDRLTFSTSTSEPRSMGKKPAATSDQFAALLESLDAIASKIQEVVEAKSKTGEAEHGWAGRGESSASLESDSGAADVNFQKEILGLFALEAHEWISQIQMALRKLGSHPTTQLKTKLLEVILQGITNLGRSAMTVQLPAIEHMASSLIPILHAVGNQGAVPTAAQWASLHEGLDRMSSAVQRLSGAPTQGEREEQQENRVPAEADESPSPATASPLFSDRSSAASTTEAALSSAPSGQLSILEALRQLQQARARSMEPTRDVLEAVIERAEKELDQGGGDIDVKTIARILKELDGLDAEFLAEVKTRVPMILRTVSTLKAHNGASQLSHESLEPILLEVESLYEAARKVNASTIMQFLQGLRTFLMVAAYRKISLALHRLEAVESRLDALICMAQQWVDIGRIERTAIDEILPA